MRDTIGKNSFHGNWTIAFIKFKEDVSTMRTTELVNYRDIKNAWGFVQGKATEVLGLENGMAFAAKLQDKVSREGETSLTQEADGYTFYVGVYRLQSPDAPAFEKRFENLWELQNYVDRHRNGTLRTIYNRHIGRKAVRNLSISVTSYAIEHNMYDSAKNKTEKAVLTLYNEELMYVYMFYKTENGIRFMRVYGDNRFAGKDGYREEMLMD